MCPISKENYLSTACNLCYNSIYSFWAGSSAVEQEPFKLLVTGSNPVRLTHKKSQVLYLVFFVRDKNDLFTNLVVSEASSAIRLTRFC